MRANKWTQTDTGADVKAVKVDGWYVTDNMDDPDERVRYPEGYMITVALNREAVLEDTGGKHVEIFFTEEDLEGMLWRVQYRKGGEFKR